MSYVHACPLFFFKETSTTESYTDGHTLSLPDALPISRLRRRAAGAGAGPKGAPAAGPAGPEAGRPAAGDRQRLGLSGRNRSAPIWRAGDQHHPVGRTACPCPRPGDRKSVGWGKRVTVGVDLEGDRIITTKKKKKRAKA